MTDSGGEAINLGVTEWVMMVTAAALGPTL